MPDAVGYSSDESTEDEEVTMMEIPAVKMHKLIGKDPLSQAAENQDVEEVAALLKAGDVDPTSDFYSALRLAFRFQNPEIARLLLQDHRVVPTGEVADLILKISCFYFEGDFEIMQVIFESGKFPREVLNYFVPCAVKYRKVPLLEWLLKREDIDPTINNNDAFFAAVQRGFTTIVQMMLKCEKVHPREGNDAALVIATRQKHPEIVKLLLSDPYIDPKVQGIEAMRIAIINNDVDLLRIFLTDGRIVPSADDAALFAQAVRSFSGDFTIIQELIDHPSFDSDLLTNLIRYAIKKGKEDLVSWLASHPRIFLSAVQAQHVPLVRFLLRNEALDPIVGNNEALRTALVAQNFDILLLLLKDMRILRSFDANRNISLVLKHFKGNFRIIDLFLEALEFLQIKGMIDPQVIQLMLPYAIRQGNIELAKWLLGHPMIEPNAAEGNAILLAVSLGNADMVKILVESLRVDPGVKHNEALLIAICSRNVAIVRTLLSSSKVNPEDQNGMFLAVSVEIGEHLTTQLLCHRVAEVSGDENLALRLAIRKKDIGMVKLILDHPKADPKIPFNGRASPLFLAIESGDAEIVKAILQHSKFTKNESILSQARNVARNLKHDEILNILTGVRGESGSFAYPSNMPSLPMTQLHHRKVAFSKIRRYSLGHSPLQPQAVLEYIFGKPSNSEVPGLLGVQLLRIAYDDFLIANPQKSEDAIQREFASFILPRQLIRRQPPVSAVPVEERKRKREEEDAHNVDSETITSESKRRKGGKRVTFNMDVYVRGIPNRTSLSYIKEKEEMEKSSAEELKRKRDDDSFSVADTSGSKKIKGMIQEGAELPNFSSLFAKKFQTPIDQQVETTSRVGKEPANIQEETDDKMEIDD